MVTQGLITPEELVEIHGVGEEMERGTAELSRASAHQVEGSRARRRSRPIMRPACG